jgi:hypothetical protein
MGELVDDDPARRAEEIVRRAKIRRMVLVYLVIFIVAGATSWVWAWPN